MRAMAAPPVLSRHLGALAPPAAAAFAALLATAFVAGPRARAEEPAPNAGKFRDEGPACAARWSTSGAARARRSRLRAWRVKLDVPRASAACTDAMEREVLAELSRELPALPAGATHPADADCRLAHAQGDDLAWACHLRWRAEEPGQLAAVVGVSATGSASGLRFRTPIASCGAEARRALFRDAVELLPPRLREAAAEAARAQSALLSTYREGAYLRVSFGRAMPQEDPSSTVARVPWETVASLCNVPDE
jgi:hypothetical protein